MFRMFRISALAALVLLSVTAGPARADEVTATVPFAFTVNGQPMPAGEYRLERDVTDPLLLVVHEVNGPHAFAFAFVRPAGGHDPAGSTPALQFTRHDGTYRLSAVWESASDGQMLVSTR